MFEPRKSQAGGPPAKGQLPVSNGGDDIHLLDRLSSIYRHKRLVISVFTVVVTLMMLQSYSTIPLYRASARILVEDEATLTVAGMESGDPLAAYWADPEPYYETQYRILKSPGLVRYTVPKLDLAAAPEFSGTPPKQFGPLEAAGAARRTVTGWAKSAGTSVLGMIRPETLEPDTGEPGDQDAPAARSAEDDAHIGGFVERIGVSPVVNTLLVDVLFTSADPAFAAEAANTHVETYIDRNLSRRLEAVQQQLAWVTNELATQQTAVEGGDPRIIARPSP